MSGSEFGRGYATCLRQFTFHRARLGQRITLYQLMQESHPDLFSESSAVEIWANGASDHLSELKRPRRGVSRAEWEEAQRVQDRALDIGHGFRPTSKSDPKEAIALLDDAQRLLNNLAERGYRVGTLDEAMATDRALGLSPEKGSWACPVDLIET